MQIKIDNKVVEVKQGETIIKTARREGFEIPSLCYAEGAVHKASCMVCAVKNLSNGQIMPSCTTIPTEGMEIDTSSEEVRLVRTLSLELLLSDHRADCDAPCSTVCPVGLDVGNMLKFYDDKQYDKAKDLIAGAFSLPEIACDTCSKVPCEKVCRRSTVDEAVEIRKIIRDILEDKADSNRTPIKVSPYKLDKSVFQSKVGRFTEQERSHLKLTVDTSSRCLHCGCSGQVGCKLRAFASEHGVTRSRYNSSSALPVLERIHVKDNMWFEQSKCIRCGLCVYNSKNGFTFKNRGFVMEVVIPEENKVNAGKELAKLCPTGAIYLEGNI
ncbi:MAG: 2Fe-2S iron-sulfur cluster-binding protein [Bacteroidales bacterium]